MTLIFMRRYLFPDCARDRAAHAVPPRMTTFLDVGTFPAGTGGGIGAIRPGSIRAAQALFSDGLPAAPERLLNEARRTTSRCPAGLWGRGSDLAQGMSKQSSRSREQRAYRDPLAILDGDPDHFAPDRPTGCAPPR